MKCSHCDGTGYLPEPSELRKMRRFAGLSLRELAIKMGCSAMWLCDLENGHRTPSAKIGKAYEKYCKV